MKIIGISSSPNRNGNTTALVREALKGAAQYGAATEELMLSDYDIRFCKGCFSCMAKGGCVINDDFAVLKAKIKAAQGVIIGSPTYAFSINGQMKQFLERFGMFEFLTSEVFGGKYFVGIATTGGSGAQHTVRSLTGYPKNGIFKRGYISATVTAATGKVPVEQNHRALKQAFSAGEKLARDIRDSAAYTFQNMFNRIVTSIFIRPRFSGLIKAGKDSRFKAVSRYLAGIDAI